MTMALVLRRGFVIVGVAAALMLGAASIRAAAEWTAASAPLAVAPASLTSIEAALQTERDRSAALETQLQSLESASGELGTALKAAQDQIDTGATTAADAAGQAVGRADEALVARGSARQGGGSSGRETRGDDDVQRGHGGSAGRAAGAQR